MGNSTPKSVNPVDWCPPSTCNILNNDKLYVSPFCSNSVYGGSDPLYANTSDHFQAAQMQLQFLQSHLNKLTKHIWVIPNGVLLREDGTWIDHLTIVFAAVNKYGRSLSAWWFSFPSTSIINLTRLLFNSFPPVNGFERSRRCKHNMLLILKSSIGWWAVYLSCAAHLWERIGIVSVTLSHAVARPNQPWQPIRIYCCLRSISYCNQGLLLCCNWLIPHNANLVNQHM